MTGAAGDIIRQGRAAVIGDDDAVDGVARAAGPDLQRVPGIRSILFGQARHRAQFYPGPTVLLNAVALSVVGLANGTAVHRPVNHVRVVGSVQFFRPGGAHTLPPPEPNVGSVAVPGSGQGEIVLQARGDAACGIIQGVKAAEQGRTSRVVGEGNKGMVGDSAGRT